MPTYVAFLRAINLGAKRKFPKDAIKAATVAAGATGVETYINTGNVLLTIGARSTEKVRTRLEASYAEAAGFEVPTIVFPGPELAAIAADARELTSPDLARHYLYLLQAEPDPGAVAALEAREDDLGRVVVRNRAAHVLLGPAYEAGNVDPWKIERTLGVVATNRNLNVVTTLADRWCS
ncbi:DUF1697 domain-containing protein [Nocardioides montaniterrae]